MHSIKKQFFTHYLSLLLLCYYNYYYHHNICINVFIVIIGIVFITLLL